MLLVVIAAAAASLVVLGPSGRAGAAVTPVSTVYKTGTDAATSSTAASADAPGGAVTGTAHPGDTIKWAVSYQNSTGDNATVNLKDPLATAGTYVPGSLQLPPNPDGAQPFAAQYSTDDNATWQPGTPPASASGVGLTGTFPPGTRQQSVHPPAPAAFTVSQGRSGYNAVTSADASLVYTVYTNDSGNSNVRCFTVVGSRVCPGWPAGSNVTATYVSPVAGTPVGTGGNGMTTAWQNGTFTAGGHLYWEAEQAAAVVGLYPVGVMCLDLASLQSCGFTQLDAIPDYSSSGLIGGSGIAAADGSYYFADSGGELLCFSPATGPCGKTALPGATAAAAVPASATYGSYVLAQVLPATGAARYSLYCFDTATSSLCPGFPATGPPPSSLVPPSPYANIAPVLDSSGNLTGACILNNQFSYGCRDLSGASVASPYRIPAGSVSSYAGDAFVSGSRVYLPYSTTSVGCYDFAGYTGTGAVPACTGFAPPANTRNFTVRPVAGQPACLLAASGGAQLTSFDTVTGGACSSTTMSETVHPADYYCGAGSAAFRAWGQLTLTGLPPGSYTQAEVSLADANGNPVAGFTSVLLPAGATTLDISPVPVTAPTSQLTVQVTLHGATAAVTAGQASLSWQGDPPQMCFQTTVPPLACGLTGSVSNTASAVTDASASGGGSDAPGGNSSGTARFTVAPGAGQCQLTFGKTASPARVQPGGLVTYTITARNAGTLDYTAAAPATFTDDLTSVLASAAYGNDAAATAGSVSYAAPVLSWSGPLAAGATVTVTYTATVHPGASSGIQDLANTVVSDSPGSNCPAAAPAAACTAAVPVDAITIVKSASPGTVHAAGDKVTYSFLVANVGSETLHGITVADTQLPPASQGGLSAITCPATTLAAGASTTCTATYTVTQGDIDDGGVDDAATASGSPPSGPLVTSPPSDASVTAAQSPGLTVAKSVPAAPVTRAGQQLRYSFLVTNTGNVTMYHVKVTDVVAPPSDPASLSPVTCPQATLAPGESETCTATYTVTQADVDHGGQVRDSATVTGVRPATAGSPAPPPLPPSPPSAATAPVAQAPGLRIVRSAATEQVIGDPAEVIRYQFTLANTGNLTLTDIGVSDPLLTAAGITVRCPRPTLAPGESETCTSSRPYVVTAADAARGSVTNTADAHARTPSGHLIRSAPSTVTTAVTPLAALIPTGEGASAAAPGVSPGLAAAGAAALSAGMVLLRRGQRRRA